MSKQLPPSLPFFLAAVTTYHVFLQSKAAEYDDRIQVEQANIRAELAGLQAHWPSTLTMFLPPEFKEKFSARSGGLHGAALVNKFAVAVLFPDADTEATLAEVRPLDTFGTNHWRGRVYFLALDEGLRVLSGGATLAPTSFVLGKAEPKPEAFTAFPRSGSGPGFNIWRSDFDQISTADRFLADHGQFAAADFQAFMDSHPAPNNQVFIALYRDAVMNFHKAIEAIRGHVGNIDALELVKSRYSFSRRVNAKVLLLLIVLAALVGVAAPLFVMAALASRITPVAATAMLAATGALVIGSFIQFGRDVFRPLAEDPKLYVGDRWLRPILEEVARYSGQLDSGATVPTARVAEYLNSDAAKSVPPALIDALKNYERTASAYNTSAEDLDAGVLRSLQNDSKFQSFRRPYVEANKRAHSVLHPADLVNPERLAQLKAAIENTHDVFLGVETTTWLGSRGRLALIGPPRRRYLFIKALTDLSESTVKTGEARSFSQRKRELIDSASEVKEQLSAFLRR